MAYCNKEELWKGDQSCEKLNKVPKVHTLKLLFIRSAFILVVVNQSRQTALDFLACRLLFFFFERLKVNDSKTYDGKIYLNIDFGL